MLFVFVLGWFRVLLAKRAQFLQVLRTMYLFQAQANPLYIACAALHSPTEVYKG